MSQYCQWPYFLETGGTEWGEEAAALASVSRSGVAVPAGFLLSKKAYVDFFLQSSLKSKLQAACHELSVKQPQYFAGAAQDARRLIAAASVPKKVSKELDAFYAQLEEQLLRQKGGRLRLWMTALADHQETVLSQEVSSAAEVEKMLKQLYGLLFTDSQLFQRIRAKEPLVPASFAVSVQALEKPEASGEAFCHDVLTHDDTTIQIQANHFFRPRSSKLWVGAEYRVDRKSLRLLSQKENRQWWAEDGEGKFVSPLRLGREMHPLSEEQVILLARHIRTAQEQFPDSKLFEWTYAHNRFWITRVSDLKECCFQKASDREAEEGPVLLRGHSGSVGRISGPVRLVRTAADREKLAPGDVAVFRQAAASVSPAWLSMAAACICENGTAVSAEARQAKQAGIPAVIGATGALSALKEGQVVTVDGSHGCVYAGVVNPENAPISDRPITGTAVRCIVSDPYSIEPETLRQADGVGLLRGEFILRMLGVHPGDILRHGLRGEYVQLLAEGIERVVGMAAPRPVIYQLHDLGSIDSIGLRGKLKERHEPNPALGYRGSHRLLTEPEVLAMELEALAIVRKRGADGFSVMLPMVRTLKEAEEMRTRLACLGSLELWAKCETPGIIVQMEKLCQLGFSGMAIDVPTLTQFMQGIDKENYQMAHYLDTSDEPIEQAISYATAVCRNEGVAAMLLSEGEALRPEVVQAAVKAGISSLAVAPYLVEDTRRLVAAIEQRMVLDFVLDEQRPPVG